MAAPWAPGQRGSSFAAPQSAPPHVGDTQELSTLTQARPCPFLIFSTLTQRAAAAPSSPPDTPSPRRPQSPPPQPRPHPVGHLVEVQAVQQLDDCATRHAVHLHHPGQVILVQAAAHTHPRVAGCGRGAQGRGRVAKGSRTHCQQEAPRLRELSSPPLPEPNAGRGGNSHGCRTHAACCSLGRRTHPCRPWPSCSR